MKAQWSVLRSLSYIIVSITLSLSLTACKQEVVPTFQPEEVSDPAENPSPETNEFQQEMNYSRAWHSATRLPDGRVLAIGGEDWTLGYAPLPPEIFDPSTKTWTVVDFGHLSNRNQGKAVLLEDGRILIAGGTDRITNSGFYSTPKEIEIYDPSTMQHSVVATLPRGCGTCSVTKLQNGEVLIAGGHEFDFSAAQFRVYKDAYIFNSTTGQLRPTFNQLRFARGIHTATLLPTGDVIMAGGHGPQKETDTVEIFNSNSEGFYQINSLQTARMNHVSFLFGTNQYNYSIVHAFGSQIINGQSHYLDAVEKYWNGGGYFQLPSTPVTNYRGNFDRLLNGNYILANVAGIWIVSEDGLSRMDPPPVSTYSSASGVTVLNGGDVLISGGGISEIIPVSSF